MISAIRPGGGSDGHLHVTANFVVVETIVGERSTVHSCGSYRDRVTAVDGRLLFVEKMAIYDAALVQTSITVPL
jgi:hypothetical protein